MANKGVSVLNFILRIVAFMFTLGSAIAMGTTNETLRFFTQFIRFRARFDDLPTFTFFVANSVASAYLILSLPHSIFHIVKSGSQNCRIISVILDTVVLALRWEPRPRPQSFTWRTKGTRGRTGSRSVSSTIPSASASWVP